MPRKPRKPRNRSANLFRGLRGFRDKVRAHRIGRRRRSARARPILIGDRADVAGLHQEVERRVEVADLRELRPGKAHVGFALGEPLLPGAIDPPQHGTGGLDRRIGAHVVERGQGVRGEVLPDLQRRRNGVLAYRPAPAVGQVVRQMQQARDPGGRTDELAGPVDDAGEVAVVRVEARLEDGYAAMLAAGLAPPTVRKVHAILSSAYEIEVRRGNVARNPCKLVEAPRLGQAEQAALSAEQARAVLAVVKTRRNSSRWSVGLACGLRQGEALGLRWQFVDLDEGTLRVWYQLQRLPWRHGCADIARCTRTRHRRSCPKRCPKAARTSGRRHVCIPPDADRLCPAGCTGHAASCPKRTGGGLVFREIKERRRKTVRLAPELAEILRAHRVAQARERLRAANVWEDDDLVWCQENGRPIDSRADWQEWSDILAEAGLPHLGVHAMRHSAATIALDEGVALAVVQEMLGHSDIRITRAYTHVSSPLAEDAAARVGRALFGHSATKTVTRRR